MDAVRCFFPPAVLAKQTAGRTRLTDAPPSGQRLLLWQVSLREQKTITDTFSVWMRPGHARHTEFVLQKGLASCPFTKLDLIVKIHMFYINPHDMESLFVSCDPVAHWHTVREQPSVACNVFRV